MIAILMRLAPYAGIGLLVFGFKHCYDKDIRDKAVADERGKVATAYRDTIKKSLDSVAKIRHTDTLRLTRTVVDRKIVFDTLEIEKLLRDTVPVPVEVVREIVRVDSVAFMACIVVKRSCEEENRLLKLDLVKSEDQTRAARSLQPSFGRQASTHTVAMVIGGLVCYFWLCPKEAK